jgi:hypothetical protein
MRKRKKELGLSGIEFRDFTLKNLASIDDLQLLIIKGHILLEYSLNKYVAGCAANSFDINSTNLTFANTLHIASALGLFHDDESDLLQEKIKKINSLRNEIAHQMEYNESIIKSLISLFLSDDSVSDFIKKTNSDLDNLRYIIVFICGEINGRRDAQIHINKLTKTLLSEDLELNPDRFLDNKQY